MSASQTFIQDDDLDIYGSANAQPGVKSASAAPTWTPERIRSNNLQMANWYKGLTSEKSASPNVKVASATGGMIRLALREGSYFDNILPPQDVNPSMFDISESHDQPRIIGIREPGVYRPRSVPFGSAPIAGSYRGDKFETFLYEIQTREFVKHVDELYGYKDVDLRQVVTDNMLRDLETEKDARPMATFDRIVGSTSGNGLAGWQQNFAVGAPIQRTTYKDTSNYFADHQLNLGVVLCNRRTFNEFLGWNRNEVGGDLAVDIFRNGARGITDASVFGMRHIVTIKNWMVPNYRTYAFGEPSYLGKHYTYEGVRVFVKRERDYIFQSALLKLGYTVANVRSIAVNTYTAS